MFHLSLGQLPQPGGSLEPEGARARSPLGTSKCLDAAHVVVQGLGGLSGLTGGGMQRRVLQRLHDGGQEGQGLQQASVFHAESAKK